MLSSRTFYDLKFNIFDTQTHTYDPVFGDNLEQYGDPANNPWPDTSIYNGVAFTSRLGMDYFQPGSQYDAWYRQRTQYWGVDLDFTTQQGKYNTIKAGFEYKYHTLRSMRIFNPVYIADDWTSDYELMGGATFQGYGYEIELVRDPITNALLDCNVLETNEGNYLTDVVRDSTGKPTDGLYSQAPYHPIIMSGYVQDKIEFNDLVLNLGYAMTILIQMPGSSKILMLSSTLSPERTLMVRACSAAIISSMKKTPNLPNRIITLVRVSE
jgi:hypothetical protein